MSEPEQLEIGVGVAGDGLFLVFAAAGDDLEGDTLPPQIRSAEAIYASDLTIEGWIPGLNVGIPNQVGDLIPLVGEGEIGRAAGGGVDGVASPNAHSIGDNEPFVVKRQRTDERDPQQRRIGVVVDALAQVLIDLTASRSRIADNPELRAVGIGRLSTDQQTIKKDFRRTQGVGERGGERGHPACVENVDVGIRTTKQPRVNRKEKATRLELIILDLAIDRLQRTVANGEDAVANDVALLLGENRLHAHCADLGDRLDSVVPAGNAGGDVARRRRLEGYVADLEALHELAALPLVVNRDVVGSVELALRVVVEIHVDALGDDASRLGGELKINKRLEGAAAVRNRVEEESGGAKRALILLAAKLQTPVQLQPEIGVLAENGQRFRCHCRLGPHRELAGIIRRRRRSGEIARRDLTPDCLHDRAHVLLERRSTRGFDLRLCLTERFALSAR